MEQCFFCGKPAKASESLHHASTFGLDGRVRQCALQLQDQSLLAKLSVGDLIALEAKYHVQCLVSLYNNRARQTKGSDEKEDNCTTNQGIALAELVAYIEDARADNEVVPIFKLADLSRMYSTRVEQLGTCLHGRVNSTNLKDRILAYFPDLQAHKEGRDIFLVFNKDVGPAMTLMPSTLLVLQTLFAERSSTRKALSQGHMTGSAKHHQCQIHWWYWIL